MTNIERLRQYLMKASFSSAGDKFSALECLSEIERELVDEVNCPHCDGTGRMVRDPDIGTDQECFVCEGSGKMHNAELRGARLFARPA
jgi:RecJ-like exonuclease